MEISESYESLLERYEALILQRDRLAKEADHYQLEYFREFGELITDAFQARIDCIALKKSISFCLMKKNSGEAIDPITMQEFVNSGIMAYKDQLQELLKLSKTSRSMVPIPVTDALVIKQIYRRIAKRLHPDICPLTSKNPELMEQFQRVLSAYRSNDIKSIREAETLINRLLKKYGEEPEAYEIEDLPEKIAAIETEIAHILETEPYTFKILLEDAAAVGKKRSSLADEKESYLSYKKDLQEDLEKLIRDQDPRNWDPE